MTEQSQQQSDDDADRLFLTFSAEDLGLIVVSIIKGVERSIAIRAMPHYTQEQHHEYEAFYDQLRDAIDWAWYQK
jgi:hypothetical protein